MNRRDFLRAGAVAPAVLWAGAKSLPPGNTDGSRNFEITTSVEVLEHAGRTRVWLPTPLVDTPYQHTLGDTYRADAGFVEMIERPADALDMLVAEWPDRVAPILTVTSRVSTRDYTVNLDRPTVPPPDLATLAPFLRGSRLAPIDGAVKDTADRVTRGAGTDLERARAIYEWVAAERPSRDPDPNGQFVALARAAGVPARSVYGLRVGEPDATRAQHARAEVYLVGFGWVPVETAGEGAARRFGSWEMNWIAFNYAHDFTLPGARRGPIRHFMYPQAETANGRIDSLVPDAFRYEITARESGSSG